PEGFSNPEIRRRHMVMPDPEGPSIAKKDPSAMVMSTRSTARTCPKWRETERNSTAAFMRQTSVRPPAERRGKFEWWPRLIRAFLVVSASADHTDVIADPAVIGHAGPFPLAAVRDRRGP